MVVSRARSPLAVSREATGKSNAIRELRTEMNTDCFRRETVLTPGSLRADWIGHLNTTNQRVDRIWHGGRAEVSRLRLQLVTAFLSTFFVVVLES